MLSQLDYIHKLHQLLITIINYVYFILKFTQRFYKTKKKQENKKTKMPAAYFVRFFILKIFAKLLLPNSHPNTYVNVMFNFFLSCFKIQPCNFCQLFCLRSITDQFYLTFVTFKLAEFYERRT